MILTALHILFIAFVIVIGFWKGSWKNFTHSANSENPSGFFPHGAAGVFNGAAAVYLSYIGYDAVSTMAEEVKEPVKDIPIGVSGSVIIVTILYCLMAASMCMLLPYDMVITICLVLSYINIDIVPTITTVFCCCHVA
jgi:amino acid transporter